MIKFWQNPNIGILILRISLGGLMLFHGWAKISGGVGYIADMLVRKELPAFFAYGVYVGELIAPAMILLGVQTRAAALIYTFTMALTIYLAFSGRMFTLAPHGGWIIEMNLLYLLGALTLLFTGGGKYCMTAEHQLKAVTPEAQPS